MSLYIKQSSKTVLKILGALGPSQDAWCLLPALESQEF